MFKYLVNGFFAALISILFLPGCMFMSEPYREVSYYDLSIPAPAAPEPVRVSIVPIRDESATKYRMLFRKNDNSLIVDDYAKWAQPPGLMLTRYLESYFSKSDTNEGPAPENTVSLSVTGAVFAFEANLESKQVLLGVKYDIRRNEDGRIIVSGSRTFTENVDDFSGVKLASAMSNCASRFTDALRKEIESVYPVESAEIKRLKAEKLANEEKEREAIKKKESELAEQRRNLSARDDARTQAVIERAAAEKANAELEKNKAELEIKKIKEQSGTVPDAEIKK